MPFDFSSTPYNTQVLGERQNAFRRQQIDQSRQDAAFNALAATYGPVAGDPQRANDLQNIDINRQNADITGQRFANEQAQQPYVMRDIQRQDQAAEAGTTQSGLLQAATYAQQQIAAGVDPGQAFDAIAPYLNVSPEQAAQMRSTIVANPDSLAGFIKSLGGDTAGSESFSLTPQFGVDANGNPVMLQLSNQGGARPVQLPEGVDLSKEPIRIDAGDHWVLLDPITRQQVGVIAKAGAPSADQRPVTDEQGNVIGYEATPGTTLDIERRAEAAATAAADLAAQESSQRTGQTVLRDVNRSLELVPQISQGSGILGAGARLAASHIAGTAEYQLQQQIDSFTANLSMDQLQAMRDANPSGASGLGQVTEREHDMLQRMLGSFDLTQPVEVIQENLRQLNNAYLDIVFGSASERSLAVADGRLDPVMAQQIDAAYYPVQYNFLGRRNDEQQPTGPAPAAAAAQPPVTFTAETIDAGYAGLAPGTHFFGPDGLERVKP